MRARGAGTVLDMPYHVGLRRPGRTSQVHRDQKIHGGASQHVHDVVLLVEHQQPLRELQRRYPDPRVQAKIDDLGEIAKPQTGK